MYRYTRRSMPYSHHTPFFCFFKKKNVKNVHSHNKPASFPKKSTLKTSKLGTRTGTKFNTSLELPIQRTAWPEFLRETYLGARYRMARCVRVCICFFYYKNKTKTKIDLAAGRGAGWSLDVISTQRKRKTTEEKKKRRRVLHRPPLSPP